MAGFPFADTLYFDDPGPVMAGWLAMQASGELQPRVAATPPGTVLLDPPVRHFNSLAELSYCLEAEHRPGSWYRGQTKRFSCVYHGRIPKLSAVFPRIREVSMVFEAIIPTAYRQIVASQPADWHGSSAIGGSRLRLLTPAIRAIAASDNAGARTLASRYLIDAARVGDLLLLLRTGVVPGADVRSALFVEGTGVLRSELELTALSQHYEFGSAMIDVSRDVDVATWFASRRWSDGRIVGAASGVSTGYIYRFDAEAITRMLSHRMLWGSGRSPFLPHVGLFGIAEIDHMSAEMGKRPAAQAGGSLFGMELSCIYFLLDVYRALSVFSFPHDSVTGKETSRTLEDLCPADDPGVKVFQLALRGHTHALSEDELASFLRAERTPESDVRDVLRVRRAGAM